MRISSLECFILLERNSKTVSLNRHFLAHILRIIGTSYLLVIELLNPFLDFLQIVLHLRYTRSFSLIKFLELEVGVPQLVLLGLQLQQLLLQTVLLNPFMTLVQKLVQVMFL